MRCTTILLSALGFIALTGFTKIKSLTVTSTAFTNNGNIPVKYTCTGQQVSPPLAIANIPAEARSLAIIVCDPDAPTRVTTMVTKSQTVKTKGKKKTVNTSQKKTMDVCSADGYTNWVVWNIDVNDVTFQVPEDFRPDNIGKNGAGVQGYTGMCPQTGTHHYHFMVYALDTKLNIAKNSTRSALDRVMDGHIVAKGEIVGTYNKTYK